MSLLVYLLFPSPFYLNGGIVVPRVTGNPRGFFVHSSLRREERTKKNRRPVSGFFARSPTPRAGAAELAALTQSSPSFRSRLPPSRPDKGGFSFFPICVSLLFSYLLPSPFSLEGGTVIPRLTGNPRRWLCFVMTGGILGGCTSQWAKSIPHPIVSMLLWLLHVLARRLCGTS